MKKKLNLFIILPAVLLFMQSAFGQGSNTLDSTEQRFTDEQRINNQVTTQSANENNTAKAKYYNVKSATGGASGVDVAEDNLTDADRQTRDNYVHQEYVQNAMDEECKADGVEKECKGSDAGNGMVQALAKAYGMIVGMGGLGGDLELRGDGAADGAEKAGSKGTDATKKGTDGAKEKETRHDFCKYVAVVTEAVSMFQQSQAHNNMTDGNQAAADTSQKASLYKAARSHKERAKTAKMQYSGWGITAGCYATMLATGAALDWNLGIKLAGSTILTIFFKKEVDKHEDAYEKVKAIADRLPGKGECNPVTENDCYCSQTSTMNDPRYCQKQLHDRQIAADSIRTTCVSKTLKQDPKCSCIRTNTCFDQEFMSMTNLSKLPNSFTKNVARPFGKLTRGELTGGAVTAADFGRKAARRALRDVEKANPDKLPKLSKSQKSEAKSLASLGIPSRLAGALASSSVNGAALAKANKSLGGAGGPLNLYKGRKGYKKGKGNVWGFGGKKGRRAGRRKKKSGNAFKKFGKKRGPTGKVINFAKKASAKAQINQDRDRPIFDIISRRYQLSGFERLEVK